MFCRFWGKAQPLRPECGPGWHPLIFHSLDVAAVGEALLAKHRRMGDHLARLLDLEREETARLATWLLCLHDVGKFAKKFQAKVPELYPPCFGDDPARLSGFYDHGAGGLRLFDADDGCFGLPDGTGRRTWRPLVSAVTGHHGAPPDAIAGESIAALRPDFGAAGIEAARRFAGKAHDLFGIPRDLPPLRRERVRPASYALAGLAVLADWIGSNQEWFPYREPEDFQDFRCYWNHARERADRAIEEAGVLPADASDRVDYDALIGVTAIPGPMQEWARSVELPDGPALFMIEDETGSGKTEAALMLAHRLMASGRADGLYMALPTMATANAMFDRLGVAHRKLFAEGTEPSVALAHGARDMHEGFRSAVLRAGRGEAPYSGAGERGGESETTASTACAAWIADDRRRAFLADAGAGTVDQALLSILPSRHQSLRLLGLMRRVLILDEVHAYDAYMQREIETLIEFQAGLGGSVILLSATLPSSIRQRLAEAFAKGLGETGEASRALEYPLATVRAAGVEIATRVPGRTGRGRVLPVRFLRESDEALAEVEQAARAGRAVLYLRNTVDDALDAHAALTARGLDPDLFHARFAHIDRLAVEKRVVETFGKRGTPARRAGKVLLTTQVVEQSLDLDFDILVSDLAPIDLLIQRAGRLWRHERREREGRPELVVVGPKPETDAKEDWFGKVFPRAAHVYRDHARLWLTARTLEDAGAIDSPGGLRSLIEAVYGDEDDAIARLPDDLKESFFSAEDRAGAERSVATTNVLGLAKGYVRDGGAWDADVRTPTRLADDPRVTLRLARLRGGRIEPYAQDAAPDDPWRAWRLSEVAVSARRVGGEAGPPEQAEAVHEAKATWTRYDADKILVVLGEAAATDAPLSGSAASGETASKEVVLGYDPRRGLVFDA